MKDLLSAFDVYLLSRERLADLSRKAYVKDVSLFLEFLQELKIPLEAIKIGTISEYHKYMYHKNLAARTRARKINALKRFFVYLHKECGYANWTSYLRTPPFEKALPNILTKREIIFFLKASSTGYDSNKRRNQLILFLLYGCGFRVSELVGIRVRDVFLNDSIIRVYGKGSKERLLPLPSICIDMLEKYIKKLPDDDDTLLFGTLYAGKIRPMTRQNIYSIIQNLWKKTGIQKRVYPHLIRHSFASHMMNNGANIREIQSLLGHERLSSTQVYTHLTLEKIKKSYETLHIRA